MADTEHMEVDPSITRMMGFSGFGNARKRRKFDPNDGFVDPKASGPNHQSKREVNNANNTAPGDTVAKNSSASQGVPARSSDSGGAMKAQESIKDSTSGSNFSAINIRDGANRGDREERSLQALRDGVRNESGDMVYFLPSFLEDPWKDVRLK